MSTAFQQTCKKLKLSLGLCLSVGVMSLSTAMPALSQTSINRQRLIVAQDQGISLPPNITEFLNDFGLKPATCSSETATLQIETNKICVTGAIPGGEYIYDPKTGGIKPLRDQKSPVQSGPTTPEREQGGSQFTFTNIRQYSNCLEDILQLYKDKERFRQQGRRSACLANIFQDNAERGLSKPQALELVRAANSYATSLLSPPLYPPQGIRRRITQEFGFTYGLDTKDKAIPQTDRTQNSKPNNRERYKAK